MSTGQFGYANTQGVVGGEETEIGGKICSMAVAPSGTRFVCTISALFAISKCGMQALLTGHRTETGFTDGQGSEARFNYPYGVTVDGDGNLLVSDTNNHAPRKVTILALSRRSQAMARRSLQTGSVLRRALIIRGAS